MRVAVLGNSGSGKSTLARWIADYTYAPLLDLDTVVWEPGKIALARSPEVAASELDAFCSVNGNWIIEGCYASLVEASLR
jgi:adenylate kinase family enzyme